MATGVTLEEAEGKKPDGFFPKLFENVCKNLSNDELDKTTEYKDDVDALVRFTYDLKQVWSLTEFSSISLICSRQVSNVHITRRKPCLTVLMPLSVVHRE